MTLKVVTCLAPIPPLPQVAACVGHCTFRLVYRPGIPTVEGRWPVFTWQQRALGSKFPRRLKKGSSACALSFVALLFGFHGLTATPPASFNNSPWPERELEQILWVALTYHARSRLAQDLEALGRSGRQFSSAVR